MSGTRARAMAEKKPILLVDDEPDVTTYLQTALEDNGYTAHTASNAVDALEMIRREKPALICLDILMPEESGISLYKKIRSDPALQDIPVLIHSGLNPSRDLDEVDYLQLEDGTTVPEPEAFIDKPADPERFIRAVERLLC